MSDEAKKLTAEEQAFWDAAAIAAMAATITSMGTAWPSTEEFGTDNAAENCFQVTAADACEMANRLLTARRERGQQ